MNHLLLDTCTWINIFSRQKYFVICENLIHLLDQNLIKLIMPSIVIDEIDKHRPLLSDKFVQSSIEPLKNAKKVLKEYTDSESVQCISFLDKCITTLTANKENNILSSQTIDKILNHSNVVKIPIQNHHYESVVNLGKAKKAPFKSKNSTSDALILCALKDYIKSASAECIFITENTSDFSNMGVNEKDLHPDIKEFLSNDVRYSINIGEIVNEIMPDSISKPIINSLDYDIVEQNCSKHDFQDGCWRVSRYGGGLSWHKICNNCGMYFDTGEYYE